MQLALCIVYYLENDKVEGSDNISDHLIQHSLQVSHSLSELLAVHTDVHQSGGEALHLALHTEHMLLYLMAQSTLETVHTMYIGHVTWVTILSKTYDRVLLHTFKYCSQNL